MLVRTMPWLPFFLTDLISQYLALSFMYVTHKANSAHELIVSEWGIVAYACDPSTLGRSEAEGL